MNPADASKCKTCGSALPREPAKAAVPAAKAAVPAKLGMLPIIAIGLVILACAVFAILSSRTTDTTGVVRSVAWQRSVAVLAQRPVTREDWRDEIPAGAQVGQCRQEIRDCVAWRFFNSSSSTGFIRRSPAESDGSP